MKIAHLINVTEITEEKKNRLLHIAQPLTLKSMSEAAKNAIGSVNVELLVLKHKSENVEVSHEFKWAVDLDRYAWETSDALKSLSYHLPLPLLRDILWRFYEASDADYFIFTNLDIGLMPLFYTHIKSLIDEGFDAIYINRRDLPLVHQGVIINENSYKLACDLDGSMHPGLDCFIFKRNIIPQLNMGNVFVGYPPVGQVLKTQIDLYSKKTKWITEEKLTFHVGSDRYWNKEKKDPYHEENKKNSKGLFISQFHSKK